MRSFVFGILVLAASGLARGEAPALAVMPLRSATLPSETVSTLDNLLVTVVSDHGGYRVVSAGDINAMLGLERMKEAAGCDDLACAVEIGGALGVQQMLVTTADVLGDSVVFTAALLDLAKSEAKARTRQRVNSDPNLFLDAIEKLITDTLGATEAQAKERTGRLRVSARDPQAVAYLDGHALGVVPQLQVVPVGVHEVTVEPSSGPSITYDVEVGEDATFEVNVPAGVPRMHHLSVFLGMRNGSVDAASCPADALCQRGSEQSVMGVAYRHPLARNYSLRGKLGYAEAHSGALLLGIGAELSLPLWAVSQPWITVSETPLELYLASDAEAHLGGYQQGTLLFEGGVRFAWLFLAADVGVRLGGGYSDSVYTPSGNVLVSFEPSVVALGFCGGLNVAF